MKKITFIFTLLCSTIMFSSISFALWEKTGESINGTTHYVDFEKIRKDDGYVYYWRLQDYSEPNSDGEFSSIVYFQVDCKLFRFKYLSDYYYTQQMGQGEPSATSNKPDKDWRYSIPNSVGQNTLELVCNH